MNFKKNKTVLVVEDEEQLGSLITLGLERADFVVQHVTRLTEAIFKLKNQKFDLLVLDLRLGTDSGEEIIDTIRREKTELNFDTPILLISAFVSASIIENYGSQIKRVLVKPFEMSELVEKTVEIIGKGKLI